MANSEDYLDGLLDSISQTKSNKENIYASESQAREERIRRRSMLDPEDDFLEANGLDGYTPEASSRKNLRRYFSESDFLKEFEAELDDLDDEDADEYLKSFEEELSGEDSAIAEALSEDPSADILDTIYASVNEAKKAASDLENFSFGSSLEDGLLSDDDSMEESVLDESSLDDMASEEESPLMDETGMTGELPSEDILSNVANILSDDGTADTPEELPVASMDMDAAEELSVSDDEEMPEFPAEGLDLSATDTLPEAPDEVEAIGEDFLQPEFEADELDAADAVAQDGTEELEISEAPLTDATVQEVPLMDESGEDIDLMDVLSSGDGDLMDIGDLLNADENLEELDEARSQYEAAAENAANDDGTNTADDGEETEKGPGILSKIKGIFVGLFGGDDEEGEDGAVAIGDSNPTMAELAAEDANILSEFSDEETPVDDKAAKAEAKKAAKEAKKKAKEEAKKAKEEAAAAKKAAKAAKPKKEKKQKEPDNSPKVPMKKLIPFVVLGLSFFVLVMVGSNTIYHNRRVTEAKGLYETGSYASAYRVLANVDDLDEEDVELYEKSRILAKMELKLRQYNLAMENEEYEEALDALIQGTYTYIRNRDAAESLLITDAYNALGMQIEGNMLDEFGVTEDVAASMYTQNDREDYTRAIRSVLRSMNLEY